MSNEKRPDEELVEAPSLAFARADSEQDTSNIHIDASKVEPRSSDPETLDQIIARVTELFISALVKDKTYDHRKLGQALLSWINSEISMRNLAVLNRDERVPPLRQLTNWQVAQLLAATRYVVRICSQSASDGSYDLLAIYATDGPDKGLYVTDEMEIAALVVSFNTLITDRGIAEVMNHLKRDAPRVEVCQDPELVPMANGVFNYATKELLDYTPEQVFIARSGTDIDFAAVHPLLVGPTGEIFDVEKWVLDLFDGDDERAVQIWQIIGALLRPNVAWDKAAWLYSTKGNNGKGTLVEMMRALVGMNRWVSLPLSEMGKDFMLEPLMRATAIITDENDVGTFIDKAANLKALITGDALMINRKNKVAVSYAFHGFMVQCLNEYPKVKDKTGSFYRRQILIPFDRSFTGHEKKWIKHDFMVNPALLRYVAKKVLIDMPAYYTISDSAASLLSMSEFQADNDPVRAFWADMEPEFVWDMLPLDFLYDLFKAWMAKVNPGGKPVSRATLAKDLTNLLEEQGGWEKHPMKRSGEFFADPEPLILEYDLKNWRSTYVGKDPKKLATIDPKPRYRTCWVRNSSATPIDPVE